MAIAPRLSRLCTRLRRARRESLRQRLPGCALLLLLLVGGARSGEGFIAASSGQVSASLTSPQVKWGSLTSVSTGLRPSRRVGRVSRTGVGEDFTYTCWEWLANLGAPAALVGGAAVAAFFELKDDAGKTLFEMRANKVVKILLISSFALEIACVFVSTVTGTMLLGNADLRAHGHGIAGVGLSAMGVLHRDMEFEYLFTRLSFFQGLLNWLGGISLAMFSKAYSVQNPKLLNENEQSTRYLQLAVGSLVAACGMMMLAFYNYHLNFYGNFFAMWMRLGVLTLRRYWLCWPPRLVPMLATLPIGSVVVNIYRALKVAGEPGKPESGGEES